MSRVENFQNGTDDGGSVVYPMDSKKWQSHPQVQAWMGHYLKTLAANYASRNSAQIAAQQQADNAEMDAYYNENNITPPGDSSWDSIMEATKDMPEIPADAYDGQEIDVPDWLK